MQPITFCSRSIFIAILASSISPIAAGWSPDVLSDLEGVGNGRLLRTQKTDDGAHLPSLFPKICSQNNIVKYILYFY